MNDFANQNLADPIVDPAIRDQVVAVVGLGYVGLPLAVEFGRKFRTIGFDLSQAKVDAYRRGEDPTGEVSREAIYGFTMSYRYTHDPRFLETARRAADYFLRRLPPDHVPYWDFDAPNIPDEPRDASAGAIAGSALLELSGYVEASPDRDRYFQMAVAIVEALSVPPYFSAEPSSRGVLQHAVGNKPGGGEIDVSLIYGDYYFIESLLRYRRLAAGEVVQEVR